MALSRPSCAEGAHWRARRAQGNTCYLIGLPADPSGRRQAWRQYARKVPNWQPYALGINPGIPTQGLAHGATGEPWTGSKRLSETKPVRRPAQARVPSHFRALVCVWSIPQT
jgi:hypothetical protein